MNETRTSYWGESMYGGYYADAYIEGKHVCFHADKLKDLKAQLQEHGLKLNKELRWDN